jgi:hypothetical protein
MAQQPLVDQGLLIVDGSRLHSVRHTTLVRTSVDARHRDLCLTRYITCKGQTSIPPPVFEPAVPTSERPQTYALGRAATKIGSSQGCYIQFVYYYPATLDLRLLITDSLQLTSYIWSQGYYVQLVC